LNGLVAGLLVLAVYACYRAFSETGDLGQPLLLLLLFLGVIYFRAFIKSYFARRSAAKDRAARATAFEAFAQKEGLSFRPEMPFREAARFLLDTGHLRHMTRPGVLQDINVPRTVQQENLVTRRMASIGTLPVTNCIEGEYRGRRIHAFDYFGRVTAAGGAPGAGPEQSVRETTVAIELPGATLPQFLVAATKRYHLDECAVRAGMYPVQWPGSPTFFKTYKVWAENHGAVRRLFPEGTTRFFELNVHRLGDWAIHGSGSWFIVFEPGHLTPAGNLESMARSACDLAGRFASSDPRSL